MGLFDVGHVAKLHEIQAARLSAGQEGIGPEVEELIRRLEMGGVGCAYLEVWRGQVRLSLGRNSDFASPNDGTLRLRRK